MIRLNVVDMYRFLFYFFPTKTEIGPAVGLDILGFCECSCPRKSGFRTWND